MATPDHAQQASSLNRLGQRLGSTLQSLSPREQRAVHMAVWIVGLGLLWWVGLAPALKTLQQAPVKQAQLDRALSQMQNLAASAEVLRTQNATPPPGRDAALRALEDANRALGASTQMALQGDRATITLRSTPPRALAQWLQLVRVNARLLPVQAQMQRGGNPDGWTGQIVLAGPGLGSGN